MKSGRSQAYHYGTDAYGFLFHMGVTADKMVTMAESFSEGLPEQGISGLSSVEPAK
jgi:hypothetical protein